jgi:hypothetical protein
LLGLHGSKDTPKREPSVQHVEGSLSAPESGALGPPLQRARESHKDFAYFRVGITFPLFASPIDPRLATKVRSTDDGGSQ